MHADKNKPSPTSSRESNLATLTDIVAQGCLGRLLADTDMAPSRASFAGEFTARAAKTPRNNGRIPLNPRGTHALLSPPRRPANGRRGTAA